MGFTFLNSLPAAMPFIGFSLCFLDSLAVVPSITVGLSLCPLLPSSCPLSSSLCGLCRCRHALCHRAASVAVVVPSVVVPAIAMPFDVVPSVVVPSVIVVVPSVIVVVPHNCRRALCDCRCRALCDCRYHCALCAVAVPAYPLCCELSLCLLCCELSSPFRRMSFQAIPCMNYLMFICHAT